MFGENENCVHTKGNIPNLSSRQVPRFLHLLCHAQIVLAIPEEFLHVNFIRPVMQLLKKNGKTCLHTQISRHLADNAREC